MSVSTLAALSLSVAGVEFGVLVLLLSCSGGIQGGQLGDERPGLHPAVDLGSTIHCPRVVVITAVPLIDTY